MTPNLLDAVEAWAAERGWWFYRSEERCSSTGRHYLNLSVVGRPPFTGQVSDYATLYEDGILSTFVNSKIIDVGLAPAHPNFFTTLETELRKL